MGYTPNQNLKDVATQKRVLKYHEKAVLVKETSKQSLLTGEILSAHKSSLHLSKLSIKVSGYDSYDIIVSSSGRNYYNLKPTDKVTHNIVIVTFYC